MLDSSKSIADNLQQRSVLEYPTLLVLFSSESASYTIATKEQELEYKPQWNESKNNKRRFQNNSTQRRNKYAKPESTEAEMEEDHRKEEETPLETTTSTEPDFLPPVPPQLYQSIIKDLEYNNAQINIPL
jgi:hypothetical protein